MPESSTRFSMHIDGEILTVRDTVAQCEYFAPINRELRDSRDSVAFKYPQVLKILESLISHQHYEIDASNIENIDVAFNLAYRAAAEDVNVVLRVACQRVIKKPLELVARLWKNPMEIAQLQYELQINETLDDFARDFGRVPDALQPFARAVIASANSSKGLGMYKVPAIDILADGMDIYPDFESQPIRFRFSGAPYINPHCLAWCAEVVRMRATRMVRLESIPALALIVTGPLCWPMSFHPDICHVALEASDITKDNVEDVWQNIGAMERNKCSIIVPEIMKYFVSCGFTQKKQWFRQVEALRDIMHIYGYNGVDVAQTCDCCKNHYRRILEGCRAQC